MSNNPSVKIKFKSPGEKLINTLEEIKILFDATEKQYKILDRCQRELRKNANNRLQKILNAVSEGNFTIRDISEATKIPYNSVHKILPNLLSQKKLIETSYKSSDRRGRSERIFKIKE